MLAAKQQSLNTVISHITVNMIIIVSYYQVLSMSSQGRQVRRCTTNIITHALVPSICHHPIISLLHVHEACVQHLLSTSGKWLQGRSSVIRPLYGTELLVTHVEDGVD